MYVSNRDYFFALVNDVYITIEQESVLPVLCFHYISLVNTAE